MAIGSAGEESAEELRRNDLILRPDINIDLYEKEFCGKVAPVV